MGICMRVFFGLILGNGRLVSESIGPDRLWRGISWIDGYNCMFSIAGRHLIWLGD